MLVSAPPGAGAAAKFAALETPPLHRGPQDEMSPLGGDLPLNSDASLWLMRLPFLYNEPLRGDYQRTNQTPRCPRPRRCLAHSTELTSWTVLNDSRCRSWSPVTGSTKGCAARAIPERTFHPTPSAACAASAARKLPRLSAPAVPSSSGAAHIPAPVQEPYGVRGGLSESGRYQLLHPLPPRPHPSNTDQPTQEQP